MVTDMGKSKKGRTTLAAETLKDIELFAGKKASSNRWMRRVSGGLQYVTDDVSDQKIKCVTK